MNKELKIFTIEDRVIKEKYTIDLFSLLEYKDNILFNDTVISQLNLLKDNLRLLQNTTDKMSKKSKKYIMIMDKLSLWYREVENYLGQFREYVRDNINVYLAITGPSSLASTLYFNFQFWKERNNAK